VRHCLYTLARLGYVASDDDRNFALRPRILALLGGLPASELAAYLKRIVASPYTNRTITAKDKLGDAIVAARESGYAIVDQELEIGLREAISSGGPRPRNCRCSSPEVLRQ
jgi:IclR family pca regulon transcriptional regulator